MKTEIALNMVLKVDGEVVLCPEKYRLLRSIVNSGSLLTASKSIGISYNKAWVMLDAVNKSVDKPVVEKARGGKGGGGAVLTDFGLQVLKDYELIREMVDGYTAKINTELGF